MSLELTNVWSQPSGKRVRCLSPWEVGALWERAALAWCTTPQPVVESEPEPEPGDSRSRPSSISVARPSSLVWKRL